jgi:quercetin dioxygenase-like cupin family protein
LKVVNEDELEWVPSNGYQRKVLLSEEDLESPGNVVQLLKVERGSRISAHHHERTTEIFYVLKGHAILFVGQEYSLRRPGDVILCKPKETHGIVNNSETDFVLAVFKLNAAEDDTYWQK